MSLFLWRCHELSLCVGVKANVKQLCVGLLDGVASLLLLLKRWLICHFLSAHCCTVCPFRVACNAQAKKRGVFGTR